MSTKLLTIVLKKRQLLISLLVFVVLYAVFFILYSNSALAVSSGTGEAIAPPAGSINPELDINKVPQLVINWLFAIATFLALAYLMYGGIKYITSRGDKVAVDSARKHLMAAVIGLVIVLGAFFALNVVFRILGANNPLENTENLFLDSSSSD